MNAISTLYVVGVRAHVVHEGFVTIFAKIDTYTLMIIHRVNSSPVFNNYLANNTTIIMSYDACTIQDNMKMHALLELFRFEKTYSLNPFLSLW